MWKIVKVRKIEIAVYNIIVTDKKNSIEYFTQSDDLLTDLKNHLPMMASDDKELYNLMYKVSDILLNKYDFTIDKPQTFNQNDLVIRVEKEMSTKPINENKDCHSNDNIWIGGYKFFDKNDNKIQPQDYPLKNQDIYFKTDIDSSGYYNPCKNRMMCNNQSSITNLPFCDIYTGC